MHLILCVKLPSSQFRTAVLSGR